MSKRTKFLPTIHTLQKLQKEFDKSFGFDFLTLDPRQIALDYESDLSSQAQLKEARLRRVEFTTLALGGEVGELANAVKKARRAAWLGNHFEKHLTDAAF